jgi:hypothetical protein
MVRESIEKYNRAIKGRVHQVASPKSGKTPAVNKLESKGLPANGTRPHTNGSTLNGVSANGSSVKSSANGHQPPGVGSGSDGTEPSAAAAPRESIPTIDISAFTSPTASEQEKRAVVEAVRHACTTYGFFQLVGHGVSLEMQEGMLERTRRFFALPMEERMEVSVSKSMGRSFRGYEPPLIQTHHEGLLPDTKEVFRAPPSLCSPPQYIRLTETRGTDISRGRRGPCGPSRRRHVLHRPEPMAQLPARRRVQDTHSGVSEHHAQPGKGHSQDPCAGSTGIVGLSTGCI